MGSGSHSPIAATNTVHKASSHASVPSPADRATGKRRILVVDDNRVNRLVAVTALERHGFDVLSAGGGQEALDTLEDEHVDFVLMDCHMPEIDGFETTRRIRARERGGRIPIVALTAAAGAHDRALCAAAGMDDFLAKPFSMSELDRVLDRWTTVPCTAAGPTPNPVPHLTLPMQQDILEAKILDGLVATFSETPGEIEELIAMFLGTLAREAPRVPALVDGGDAEALAVCAHRMAGAALQLGARRLGEQCRSVEHDARGGRLDRAGASASLIHGYIAELLDALAESLARRGLDATVVERARAA